MGKETFVPAQEDFGGLKFWRDGSLRIADVRTESLELNARCDIANEYLGNNNLVAQYYV